MPTVPTHNSSEDGKSKLHSLLQDVAQERRKKRREVIYGLYDSSQQSMLTRLDDFFIDHSRVPLQEKVYFFHLLAVMIDAGIPLVQALKMLASRSASERFYRVLNTVGHSVSQGTTLSDSMSRFPDIFGDMEIGVVRSGEAAGNLEKMLFRLSSQLDKTHELQMKLVTASIYPLAVVVVMIAVSTAMLVWVIPGMVRLLTEAGLAEKDFPFATRLLIGISGFFVQFWWAVAIVVLLAVALFRAYTQSDDGRFHWDLIKLKIPVIGLLLRRVLVLRFVSTLGILIESGIPVTRALQIIASSLNNELYRLKTWDTLAKVQQGQKISTSLAEADFLFPETVTQMLAVGEQSASMGTISEKVAAHYDREIDNALKRLTSLFEPIMIVLVGLTVAILALAVLTPIFQLSQLV